MRYIALLLAAWSLAAISQEKSPTSTPFDPTDFKVEVEHMIPLRWSPRPVSSGYSLAISNDTVRAHLPYLGVAYIPDPDTNGLNFEKPIEQLHTSRDRRGRPVLTFACRKGIVAYFFRLTVYPNGITDIRMTPSNADAIGYEGRLEE